MSRKRSYNLEEIRAMSRLELLTLILGPTGELNLEHLYSLGDTKGFFPYSGAAKRLLTTRQYEQYQSRRRAWVRRNGGAQISVKKRSQSKARQLLDVMREDEHDKPNQA